MNKPLLGVIGGMGTQATACFYEILHNKQNVVTEQEYLDVLVYSMPSIPDRTAFITGRSTDSPLGPLLHAVKTLGSAGASLLAMLCVTSHFFYDDLKGAVSVPFLHMPEETARFIAERGNKKVGLLATDGTLKGRMFHTAFEKFDIDVIVPPSNVQSGLMALIYDIKRGVPVAAEVMDDMTRRLCASGAEAVVLGCTELCVIANSNPNHINTLEVLAETALKDCLT
jgi:aspartate racemase